MKTFVLRAVQLVRDRKGVTALEYALVAAVLVTVIGFSFHNLGNNLNDAFNTIGNKLQNAANNGQ